MRKYLASVLLLLFVGVSLQSGYTLAAWGFEIDRVIDVSRVIDGDTIELADGDRVRFADIDAPETYEAGYQEAKDYVKSVLDGKKVYLDIDDFTRTDRYGRLICVVYFDYNATHYKNLNKALLDDNLSSVWDFENNDFNPYLWDLYVTKAGTSNNVATPLPTISPTDPFFGEITNSPDPLAIRQQQVFEFSAICLTIMSVSVIGFFIVNRAQKRKRHQK